MHFPSEDAGELELLLFKQSGVITWAQATALLSPGKVRQRIATGRWRRLCRGGFVTTDGQQDPGHQVWAAVLAAGQGAVLAGLAPARVGRMPNLRRRQLIRNTLNDLAGGADALSEIDLVRVCRRFGLPAPVHQQRRKDAAGWVRYLDAYRPEWQLHVEVDGAHHMEVGQWEADMRRQNDSWVAGDRILRFPAFQVRYRPADVADQIRRALVAAGWR